MTRALVLSGGGVKGAFQVGALMHSMGDLGRDYDIVCGVSVGALNAAGLCNVKRGMPSFLLVQILASFVYECILYSSYIVSYCIVLQ